VIVEKTPLEGLLLIKPNVNEDKRGYFYENYRDELFEANGLPTNFRQDNQTKSVKGTLRGLHYQLNYPQGKLVRVSFGTVYDVAVDIRKTSPTFSQYFGVNLTDKDHIQMYIPPGFAHGFCVLSDQAIFQYKCTEIYHPEDEYGIRWDDPQININWSIIDPVISDRDLELPFLAEQKNIPVYEG
jgi:dTDP-4-dehydrorhamnose 3,5-epimerase